MTGPDFSQAPFLVIWETTRACELACRHCRAEAMPMRYPGELTTKEGKRLLDWTAEMGTPIFVFSGGDCLKRDDLEELVRYGKGRGLRVGAIPAATPLLTFERVASLKEAGVDQLALSLDAPTAEAHDDFRRAPGSFRKALEGAAFARELGVPLQLNTCLAAWNLRHLDALIELVSRLGIVFWEVFFLVPTGRGREMDSMRPREFEEVFEKLHALSRRADFIVKVTEAPHYRRFVTLRERADGAGAEARIRHALARPRGVRGSVGQSPASVNAGKGYAFVDHVGNVCPSGFLPVTVGNVRERSLIELYREAPLFVELRDSAKLKGKCGACEFAASCGGSRARAWALTGDPFASDPFCAYRPKGYQAAQAGPLQSSRSMRGDA